MIIPFGIYLCVKYVGRVIPPLWLARSCLCIFPAARTQLLVLLYQRLLIRIVVLLYMQYHITKHVGSGYMHE